LIKDVECNCYVTFYITVMDIGIKKPSIELIVVLVMIAVVIIGISLNLYKVSEIITNEGETGSLQKTNS